MKDSYPINFHTEMVLEILKQNKIITRRILNPQPHDCTKKHLEYREAEWRHEQMDLIEDANDPRTNIWACRWCGHGCEFSPGPTIRFPYGRSTGGLWCKESFQEAGEVLAGKWQTAGLFWYSTDGPAPALPDRQIWRKRPARFMPRIASRLDLQMEQVRVEKLHDLDDAEAHLEGVQDRAAYRILFDKINGKGAWARNDLVWRIKFNIKAVHQQHIGCGGTYRSQLVGIPGPIELSCDKCLAQYEYPWSPAGWERGRTA